MGLITGLVLGGLLLASPALGAGMRVEPGKWRVQSSAVPPTGAGDDSPLTSCLTEDEMSPEAFMKEATGCVVKDARSDAGSMSWSMTCESAGAGMSGDARFTSKGDSFQGTMNMHMRAGGMKMTMTRKWQGERLGPCD